MAKRTRLSMRLIALVGILAYILFNVVSLYYLAGCKKVFNATYVFKDHRGKFEAVMELSSDIIDAPDDTEETDFDDVGETSKRASRDRSEKRACDCEDMGLPTEVQIKSPTDLCPIQPPNLVGRLGITTNTTSEELYNRRAISLLAPGGFYTPRDCVARETVAIIVPYRERPRHLKLLLFHLHTVLQRQQLQYHIFVVEMAYPVQFNRGLLANVGFLTARGAGNFTCYVVHDVDQLPADDRNMYTCSSKNPRHLSVSNSKYGYKLPYGHYMGGNVAFTPDQFLRINGFSNSYFGWGKEDDDLYNRIRFARYKVERPDPEIGVYVEIPHKGDYTNADNPMKDGLYVMSSERFTKDGLNSVLYTRLALEYRPLFTWVYVNTSETLIMKRLERIYARIDKNIREEAGS